MQSGTFPSCSETVELQRDTHVSDALDPRTLPELGHFIPAKSKVHTPLAAIGQRLLTTCIYQKLKLSV